MVLFCTLNPMSPKHRALTLFLLGSSALAQIALPPSSLISNPALKNFKALENGTFSDGKTILSFDRKAKVLKNITVSVANTDLEGAGSWLSLTTGRDYTAGFTDFLKKNRTPLEGASLLKPLVVHANEFTLSLYQQKDRLIFNVLLEEIATSQFNTSSLIKGDAKAPIVIRVFSDFQCPYCQKLESEFLAAYKRKLPKDVRLEFHHMPLVSIHPNAFPSAEAAECAAEQNKFWEFHDLLFGDRSWVSLKDPKPTFYELAAQIKLNPSSFKNCVETHKYKAKVDAGLAEGSRLGVNGTPTVFVGGYKLANGYLEESYEQIYKLLR
jgi:protein-disulfide isomerase